MYHVYINVTDLCVSVISMYKHTANNHDNNQTKKERRKFNQWISEHLKFQGFIYLLVSEHLTKTTISYLRTISICHHTHKQWILHRSKVYKCGKSSLFILSHSMHACSCVSLLSIALLLPVPAIVVILTNKDYEVGFVNLPTAFCHTKNQDVVHYSAAFIINIILFIGIPMLSYLLWTLHKV